VKSKTHTPKPREVWLYDPANSDINNTVKMTRINTPEYFKTMIDNDLNYYSTTDDQPHRYKA
jgi:hypothetical protein